MSAPPGAEIVDNPAPEETRVRRWGKWVACRVLSPNAYQRLLARFKAHDFRNGRFREPELDLVAPLLQAGDTAVDVGANHGMWTLALSAAVGDEGRVCAFQPVPDTFGVLDAVVRGARLGNVTLINEGCSDEAGPMEMIVPMQDAGSSDDLQAHLAARDSGGSEDGRESQEVTCEMTTLDTALERTEGVALLKIDIEGAELLALRGGEGLIERERPAIVCEVDAEFLDGFGQKPADVVAFLARWGYLPYRYDGEARRLDRLTEPERIGHANVVFLTEAQRGLVEDLIA